MMLFWGTLLAAVAGAADCRPGQIAHGLAQAPDPAALLVLAASQDPPWQVFLHRTQVPGCAALPALPSRRERRQHGLSSEPDLSAEAASHAVLGWGRPPVDGGRIGPGRLRRAREALCSAPRLDGPAACGAAPLHVPVAAPWPADPPWLVRVDRPGLHRVTLHLRVPLGEAGPTAVAVAAHRLALAYSGPLHRALREDSGLVYSLGADIRVGPGRSVLVLELTVPPDKMVAVLRAAESVRRRLEVDPVGALGGVSALSGSARSLALDQVLREATPAGTAARELVAFVGQGDPAAPQWAAGQLAPEALAAGAETLARAPWTWLVEGDALRIDPMLAAAGLRPERRWPEDAP